uniref:Tail specific protease domain-containing protein n=1 Tax=Chromera velia CCMP2878 TaxID=1169474 RepID=A0A0G4FXP7_9ALVE|eukprot:Cvel_19300.t1-p1 / transcript=Cvel_19300.t1 / gene=Cvel_19300 / organism=Chromera_velia_CCMP2878 / gene_product=Retinol-binding protein 3, putative / transcript_product=Retinol-binding protein 3, putative / location=Cvel_scaffold1653:6560-8787(-) / protein_length=425 / sequence_SO=supercontig / SO=protein_coding / is_pseudo=false
MTSMSIVLCCLLSLVCCSNASTRASDAQSGRAASGGMFGISRAVHGSPLLLLRDGGAHQLSQGNVTACKESTGWLLPEGELSEEEFGRKYGSALEKCTVSKETAETAADQMRVLIDENYVYATTARAMNVELLAAWEAGRLMDRDSLSVSCKDFVTDVFEVYFGVCHDRHFSVCFQFPFSEPFSTPRLRKPVDVSMQTEKKAEKPVETCIRNVTTLPRPGGGVVGFLDIACFPGKQPEVTSAVDAAMSRVADTDALIFDLRNNMGGSPELVHYYLSYVMPPNTHVIDTYYRTAGKYVYTLTQGVTEETVPGKSFGPSKPIYVLCSNKTASGGEEFSFDVQLQKRGTVVGDTTWGGAHPVSPFSIGSSGLSIFVPSGTSEDPLSKDNWEIKGVSPDVHVHPDRALDRALEMIDDHAKLKVDSLAFV